MLLNSYYNSYYQDFKRLHDAIIKLLNESQNLNDVSRLSGLTRQRIQRIKKGSPIKVTEYQKFIQSW